jgi:hypothetical protein
MEASMAKRYWSLSPAGRREAIDARARILAAQRTIQLNQASGLRPFVAAGGADRMYRAAAAIQLRRIANGLQSGSSGEYIRTGLTGQISQQLYTTRQSKATSSAANLYLGGQMYSTRQSKSKSSTANSFMGGSNSNSMSAMSNQSSYKAAMSNRGTVYTRYGPVFHGGSKSGYIIQNSGAQFEKSIANRPVTPEAIRVLEFERMNEIPKAPARKLRKLTLDQDCLAFKKSVIAHLHFAHTAACITKKRLIKLIFARMAWQRDARIMGNPAIRQYYLLAFMRWSCRLRRQLALLRRDMLLLRSVAVRINCWK